MYQVQVNLSLVHGPGKEFTKNVLQTSPSTSIYFTQREREREREREGGRACSCACPQSFTTHIISFPSHIRTLLKFKYTLSVIETSSCNLSDDASLNQEPENSNTIKFGLNV